MLSQTQRQELRRILGYPALANAASTQLGYPGYASQFAQWQPYAWLEDRMTQIAPGEEVEIFGQESALFSNFLIAATVAFVISTPSSIANGATLALTVGGAPITVTASANDTPTSFVARIVAAVGANPTAAALVMPSGSAAKFTATAATAGYAGNGTQISVVSSDPTLQVALAVPVGTPTPGQYAFGVTQGGADPPGEKYVLPDQPNPIYGYVSFVRILEGDLANARKFLYFLRAGEFSPRQDEIAARKALLRHYRLKIAERLNAPLDPDLVGNHRRRRMRLQ